MIFAGIDAGSRFMKVLLAGEDGEALASAVRDQGISQGDLAGEMLDEVLAGAGRSRDELGGIVATGYGRDSISLADTTVTEITCQARGVRSRAPAARTVVDIGGQDSKVLRLDENGRVRDFVMNDRCAAGTGRFLEVVADRLGVGLEELGRLAGGAGRPASISSMCVVFAETEIIGLLASGEEPENIAAGVQGSMVSRIASMAGSGVAEPVVFTGGVALVPGMKEALESALGSPVSISADAWMTCALGAALCAAEQ